jgi:Coenzyme PQQ synthesis protein D (PqqD)
MMPIQNPQALFTELDDGTGVLLHLDTKFYYTLNPTAVVVWKALGAGASPTVEAIAGELSRAFRVDREAAAKDVAGVLDEMLADGLLLAPSAQRDGG